MHHSINIFKRLLAATAVVALLSCMGACSPDTDNPSKTGDPQESESSDTQVLLENGYAQMYQAVSGLGWTDKIFLVKFETEPVEQFGKRLAETAGELKSDLEMMAERHAWLNLENTGLPEIESRKISAVQSDRLKSFAPLTGRSQANFERTLLLSNSGALNQMQHLAQVLLEIETDPDRKQFLQQAQQDFSDLYEADIELLNTEYFCDNTAAESKEFR